MRVKIASRFGLMRAVCMIFGLLTLVFHAPKALASTNWADNCWQDISSPSWELADSLLNPPPNLWRHSYIWDVMTAEQISRPDESIIIDAYEQNNWKPFFIGPQFALSDSALKFLKQLDRLEADLVDPKPYQLKELHQEIHQLEQVQSSLKSLKPAFNDAIAGLHTRPDQQRACSSAAEMLLQLKRSLSEAHASSSAAASFLKDLESKYQQLFELSSKVDTHLASALVRFSMDMDPGSQGEQIQALTGHIPLDQFLNSLEPDSPRYLSIKKAFAFYRSLATQSKFKPYPHALSLRTGDEGKPVRDLQERLKQEGLYKGEITGRIDTATDDAVKEFQIRHMLPPDGVLGPQTRKWLNVTYEEKAQMLAQSLKLLRQSKTRHHDRFLRINTPQFLLEYFKDGRIEASHRVIVGKAAGKKIKLGGRLIGENQTPNMASTIDHIVINPRWYVSDRIRKEMDEAMRGDPEYFARNGYVKMASLYPWGEPRIYQLPGPKNPLGHVVFKFDNPYAVFMHDTPNKYLFQRSRRDFSHGCVRLNGAVDLAKELLEDDNNAAAAKLDSLITRQTQSSVELNTPIPIIIEYVPVSTDENGRVIFCGDPYSWFQL